MVRNFNRSCPIYTPQQTDSNENGIGDACESCCGIAGDADDNGSVDISDLTSLVDHMIGGGVGPVLVSDATTCIPEACTTNRGLSGLPGFWLRRGDQITSL